MGGGGTLPLMTPPHSHYPPPQKNKLWLSCFVILLVTTDGCRYVCRHVCRRTSQNYPGQTFRHNRIAHGLELQVPITRVVGSSLRKFPACWFLPRFAVVNPLPVLPLSIFGFRGTISLLYCR